MVVLVSLLYNVRIKKKILKFTIHSIMSLINLSFPVSDCFRMNNVI